MMHTGRRTSCGNVVRFPLAAAPPPGLGSRVQRRSAQIAGELEQEILAGKLPPGERLPSEEKYCERFGASRTVIREAIQQLRGRGLLRT